MSAIAAAPAPNSWDELTWLLGVLEDWLLISEPATIRELSGFLRSIGSTATTGDVLNAIGWLRTNRPCNELGSASAPYWRSDLAARRHGAHMSSELI